jgi:hypothetical protein
VTPTRRRVLLGGAALAVVASVGVVVEAQPAEPRIPRAPLRVLSPRAFAALAAVAERVVVATEGLPTAWELRVPEKVDALLDALPPGAGDEVRQALLLLESPTVSLVFGGAPRPFSRLAPDAQDRVLAAWRDSRFSARRRVWKAVTGLVKSAYWSDPAMDAFIGYRRMAFPS